MNPRYFSSLGALAIMVAALSLMAQPVAGQAPAAAAKPKSAAPNWAPARTAWGEPDIQGIWTMQTITPLQRPAALAGKEFLSEQEAAALERERVERALAGEARPQPGNPGTYNRWWSDNPTKVVPSRRTSLITDPADGKIPALTPEGSKRAAERQLATTGRTVEEAVANAPYDKFDNWLALDSGERCITDGLPYVPGPYNNNYLILQTPGYVTIVFEMFHDVRVIPVDGRPHLAQPIRQWLGDSVGHWEGNTLVVDTTNFRYILGRLGRDDFQGLSGDTFHLVERFTRTAAGTIEYQFTMDDPTTFSRPWTAVVPMDKTEDEMFEYACHEGNYSIANVLKGARAREQAAADAKKEAR